jgi:hypothetical protein
LEFFNSKAVPLKPEAPWIKKCSFGIKFTDEIYITDDDRENTPDEDKEYKKRKNKQPNINEFEGEQIPRSLSEKVTLRRNIFETDEEHDLAEATNLIRLFKQQYPEAEIDLEPCELDSDQLQQIRQAL